LSSSFYRISGEKRAAALRLPFRMIERYQSPNLSGLDRFILPACRTVNPKEQLTIQASRDHEANHMFRPPLTILIQLHPSLNTLPSGKFAATPRTASILRPFSQCETLSGTYSRKSDVDQQLRV
jgi:hypothetical protein